MAKAIKLLQVPWELSLPPLHYTTHTLSCGSASPLPSIHPVTELCVHTCIQQGHSEQGPCHHWLGPHTKTCELPSEMNVPSPSYVSPIIAPYVYHDPRYHIISMLYLLNFCSIIIYKVHCLNQLKFWDISLINTQDCGLTQIILERLVYDVPCPSLSLSTQ